MEKYQFLLAPLIGWLVAQSIKFGLSLHKNGLQWSDFTASGGMPSSHTAAMMALTTLIWQEFGVSSAIFALSATATAIIIYDAQGVRRSVGSISDYLVKKDKDSAKKQIHVTHGHSWIEVLFGAVVGVAVGLVLFII